MLNAEFGQTHKYMNKKFKMKRPGVIPAAIWAAAQKLVASYRAEAPAGYDVFNVNTWIGQQAAANPPSSLPQGSAHPLLVEEQAKWGATHRIILRAGDIPAGIATATGLVLNCLPIAPNQAFEVSRCVVAVPFAITSNPAYNSTLISVGDLESNTQHAGTLETNANAAGLSYIKIGQGNTGVKVYTAIDAIVAAFTAPGAGITLSSINVGELHIYVKMTDASSSVVA